MGRRGFSIFFLAGITLAAAVLMYIFSANNDGASYTVSSRGIYGTSLLFDTLRHLGHPVRVGHRPLNRRARPGHVYVIIQPRQRVDRAAAEEILAWVEQGGRLIFLHNTARTVFDGLITSSSRQVGEMRLFEVGYGEIVTGRAAPVTNRRMMGDPSPGQAIHDILARWGAERVYFAEYYQGPGTRQTFLGGLPQPVRLVMAQMCLAGAALLWHKGKRFGTPVPLFEETEREENEYVHALARLYMKVRG